MRGEGRGGEGRTHSVTEISWMFLEVGCRQHGSDCAVTMSVDSSEQR